MKTLLFAAGLSIGCLLSTLASAQGSVSNTPPAPPDVIKSCESCHGAKGNSTVALTPRLNGQQAGYIADRLQGFLDVTKQTPHATYAMWERASSLKDSAKTSIARYFSGQPATPAKSGTLAAEGKRIYENGVPAHDVMACQLCHGAHGEGHDATPRLAGQHADYLKTQLWMFSVMLREHKLMHPNTKTMTSGEIDALASYLASD